MNQIILLQGAMPCEVAEFRKFFMPLRREVVAGFLFDLGEFQGSTVIISETGVGLIQASCATTLALERYRPTHILNQGLAGAHREDLSLGDVILGKEVRSINSFAKPQSPLEKKDTADTLPHESWEFQDFWKGDSPLLASEQLLQAFRQEDWKGKLLEGVLGSGDVWNREDQVIRWIHRQRNTLSEDMESLGVYKIAQAFSVPCLGIRIISNNELTGTGYDETWAKALQEFICVHFGKLLEFCNS